MARFKVEDIPKNQKISTDELKTIRGGAFLTNCDAIKYFKDKDHDKWADIISNSHDKFCQ